MSFCFTSVSDGNMGRLTFALQRYDLFVRYARKMSWKAHFLFSKRRKNAYCLGFRDGRILIKRTFLLWEFFRSSLVRPWFLIGLL